MPKVDKKTKEPESNSLTWHSLKKEEVAEEFQTSLEKGLSESQARIRLEREGKNKLPKEKPLSDITIFLEQLKSPLIYILIIAGIITLFFKEWTNTAVIFAAVLLNSVVGYFQEKKASHALRKLKRILKIIATVIREGKPRQVPQEDLVPGDIIILKAGDKVPADGRIIEAVNLKVNEAVLTGEWIAADKKDVEFPKDISLADRDNMVYMGTTVENGEGKAIVTETGANTEIGKVASMVRETKEEKTPYQKKLGRLSKIMGIAVGLISIFIFIAGIATGRKFAKMFATAVAVAVAAIPEGLPVAMTVILATGMQRILKKNGLVRRLSSAETLGSTSIIATDKTLTLTEGKMKVKEIASMDKKFALKIATLCNEAFIENPSDPRNEWRIIGRPTDRALILAGIEAGFIKYELEKKYPQIGEIPFNNENKFIVSLNREKDREVLYISGAPENVIQVSSKIVGRNGVRKMDIRTLERLNQKLEDLTKQGLRVVAVAYKKIPKKQMDSILEKVDHQTPIKEMTFVGLIGLEDPIRPEAKKAIQICKKAGMRPIIVTGDHILTAKAVARELGLPHKKENLMDGKELESISDKELGEKLNKISVFARVEPKHKLRIIDAWQRKNHVVAMTGDGINDAPALRKADIGVSLGSGTEVAKEVSDLVLLNDNFSIIVSAIEEGRAILDNIRKVITYLLSDTFSEIILIGFSIIGRLPLPVTAAQILWVNLIQDGLPSISLAFEPKENDLMKQKPAGHRVSLLTKEMKAIILIIGIITDIILLGIFLWLLSRSGDIRYVRTMVFSALGIDSLFYIFSCKSLRKNIWHIDIFSNRLMIIGETVGFAALIGVNAIPFLRYLFNLVQLGILDWLIILGIGVMELTATEIAKYYFIVKHQTNV